jgi:hypothetical protein
MDTDSDYAGLTPEEIVAKLLAKRPDGYGLAPWEEATRADGTRPPSKSFWALTLDDWREAWHNGLRRLRVRREPDAS